MLEMGIGGDDGILQVRRLGGGLDISFFLGGVEILWDLRMGMMENLEC